MRGMGRIANIQKQKRAQTVVLLHGILGDASRGKRTSPAASRANCGAIVVTSEIILIVDDNPGNLSLTEKVLANAGYRTQVAADAEQALRKLRSDAPTPDLILMDIQLPGVDGLTLTRLLKNNLSTRDITVVAITGYAMAGDEQRASAAGCDDFISKPISPRALLAIISYHLARRRQPLWPRPQQMTSAQL